MSSLDDLAEQVGIESGYLDIWGKRHETTAAAKTCLLEAMGVQPDEPSGQDTIRQTEPVDQKSLLDSVYVLRETALAVTLSICRTAFNEDAYFLWRIEQEGGQCLAGTMRVAELRESSSDFPDDEATLHHWPIPRALPIGYHRLSISTPDATLCGQTTLIVCPNHCHRPPQLEDGKRLWGISVNLYGVRSTTNWGIGDFGDLRKIIEICPNAGINVIGLNPLHGLFAQNPAHASPYSPSNRLFMNVIYLDIEEIARFEGNDGVQGSIKQDDVQTKLAKLRSTDLVDYPAVAETKLEFLRMLFDRFFDVMLPTNSDLVLQFRTFVTDGGSTLYLQAVFDALQAHHAQAQTGGETGHGAASWPDAYRDATSPAVEEFARGNSREVNYWLYLQWHAHRQLRACSDLAAGKGLALGLYRDLAVSADPHGAEVWSNRTLYARDVTVGAPPDELAPQGQNWGLPPLIPHELRRSAYRQFVELLRKNMQYAGALRIDHVMGLMRLFWIPPGHGASDGAYVRYPFAELLAILALESQRNQCLIVGEDLGTVPDEVREAMADWGILSYKVFLFERDEAGEVKRPDAYPSQAVVVATTHDLPTVSGYWQERDIEWRDRLGIFPHPSIRAQQVDDRRKMKQSLLAALSDLDLFTPTTIDGSSDQQRLFTPEPSGTPSDLCVALHTFLARTPTQLSLIQLEDILGQVEQVNLPGTVTEHPNWRRKLTTPIEEWTVDNKVGQLFHAIAHARSRTAD